MDTILQTAKLNGVNLGDALSKIAEPHPVSRTSKVAPWMPSI
jgi:hypothetical protein